MSGNPEGLQSAPIHKDHLYKILVIGEFGVGKTSIIRRYTEGFFSPNYKLTIGVDFALKTLDWGPNTRVNLQLWDIAGHERFGHMTRVYYKYATSTFEAVKKWLDDVNSKVMLPNEDPIPILLLANKCDLSSSMIDTEKLNSYIKENNMIAWFPTSAKDNINIDESIQYLVQHIFSLNSDVNKNRSHEPAILPKNNSLMLTDEDDAVHYQMTNTSCCGS